VDRICSHSGGRSSNPCRLHYQYVEKITGRLLLQPRRSTTAKFPRMRRVAGLRQGSGGRDVRGVRRTRRPSI
jgi:hypothetical protein